MMIDIAVTINGTTYKYEVPTRSAAFRLCSWLRNSLMTILAGCSEEDDA